MSDNKQPTLVEAAEPDKKTSRIVDLDAATTVRLDSEAKTSPCYWNDADFAPGEKIMVDGQCYECMYAMWSPVSE